MPEIAKSLRFYANSRGGPKGTKTLHVETDGAVVNVTVGLTDREGRAVTSVDVVPDDERRGGDGEGRTWAGHPGDHRVIRQHHPDEHENPERPFRTRAQTRELMACHIAGAAGYSWDLLTPGAQEAWRGSADLALDIAYGVSHADVLAKARAQDEEARADQNG